MLKYTIATGQNETDILSEYGVHVSGTTGMVGRPELKTPTKYGWDYLNGEWIDLGSRRYKTREITMKCWLKGTTKQQAIDKLNLFLKALNQNSLIRLRVSFVNDISGTVQNDTKDLFYLVYLSGSSVSRYRWRKGEQVVEFEIKLTEPSPVKKIYTITGTDVGSVTVACTTSCEMDIHWGDGGVDYDLVGTVSKTHNYTTTGRHYLIVTGVIPEITNFTVTTSTEITAEVRYDEI